MPKLTIVLVIAIVVLLLPSVYSSTSFASTTKAALGATVSIDYPVLAGDSAAVTRTLSVSNPIGNPAITTVTITIPAGASSSTPAGTFPLDSGVPPANRGPVDVFGDGPWAVVYEASVGNVLIPGGSTIRITISFTTEAAQTIAGVADNIPLSTSVTDTTEESSVLNPVNIIETSSTSVTITGPSSLQQVAGKPFQISVQTAQSGIPLYVSNATNVLGALALSPSSFNTSSSPTTVTVTDTSGEYLTLLAGAAGTLSTDSSGGILNPGTSSQITVSKVSVKTNQLVYVGERTLTVSGMVTPMPASGTSATIVVFKLHGPMVTIMSASVDSTTGDFTTSFTTGGIMASGIYIVYVVWAPTVSSPVASSATEFLYIM